MRKDSAVLEALDLFKQPARARTMRRHDLPGDMLDVIKIAAGDQETTHRWAESCREKPDAIRQSAVFFLQQTIAKSGDDKFRMLGLPGSAGKDEIRLHKRWLLKWLHPDRNPSKWETVLFHRISSVAELLESSRDIDLTTPEFSAIEIKPVAVASTYKSAPRHRSQRSHKSLRSPVPRMNWKNLLRRVTRRVFLAAVLLVLGFVVAMIFTGPLQNTLQSMTLGM